jgi:dynein heavy chain
MDHQGWYNRKELSFMSLEDTVIMSAMGPPGGGRTFVTNRLLRHYSVLGTNDFDAKTIMNIFETMLRYFFGSHDELLVNLIPIVVSGSISLYFFARSNLLPTPGKSHYQFNLRDIWRVIQGVC